VEQDYDRARHYYEQATGQSQVKAHFNLGVLYENGHGVDKDYQRAKE
jgi:TPR repeat protein